MNTKMKLTETKMAQITSDILFANREQLTLMVQAIQHRRNTLDNALKNSFNKGDKVWFRKDSGNGAVVNAIIIKRNPKSIQCHELNNKYSIWNVSPSLLKRGHAPSYPSSEYSDVFPDRDSEGK